MTRFLDYYVHGRGRGHATRSYPVIRALERSGWDVRVFAGEAAASIFEPKCVPIRSVPQSASRTALKVAIERIDEARLSFQQRRPLVVVSDGDMPSVYAAKRLGIPTIAVGHGLMFAHCKMPRGLDRWAWMRESVKAHVASWGADAIVVSNFVNVRPKDPRRVRIARPCADFGRVISGDPEANIADEDSVVCYFRDDNGDAIAEHLAGEKFRVRLFTSNKRSIRGVIVEPWGMASFRRAIHGCRAVVSSAGSQLMNECASLNVPQFAYYRERDDEQKLNAQLLSLSGMGDCASLESRSRDRLVAFLRAPPKRTQTLLPKEDIVVSVLDLLTRLTQESAAPVSDVLPRALLRR